MALVNVASEYPYSIEISSNPPSAYEEPLFTYDIVGTGDPSAVGGYGVTYGVEDVAYTDWTTKHPDLADGLELVTQQQIDDMTDLSTQYGFEQFLPTGTTSVADIFGFGRTVNEDHAAVAFAASQVREAEARLREAELMRKQADQITEEAKVARDAAAEAQTEAARELDEKAQPLREASQHAQNEPQPQREA
jgi:hypothetical protein